MKNRPAHLNPNLLDILLAIGLIAGCQVQESGTEIPNELIGRELVADGNPAVGAKLRLVPIGHIPGEGGADSLGSLIFSASTDRAGNFTFREVPEGRYNIMASADGLQSFRDSVRITGKAQTLPKDTLRTPGSLTGLVRLQPQHDARTATVQVLGTNLFVNVEETGRFQLKNLGDGEYRLRVVTTVPGYVPLFKEASVKSGSADSISEPLEPFYSGIPVVLGLSAMPDSDGTIRVRWNRSSYRKIESYVVARDSAGVLIPLRAVHARVSDTTYLDTIYSRTPRAGQYPYQDTVGHAFEYRVMILDKSGEVGPSFGMAQARAVPPSKIGGTGLWKAVPGEQPFTRKTGASLVVAQNRVWMLGGEGVTGYNRELWSSADGISWELATDSLPFQDTATLIKAVAFRDSLYVLKSVSWEEQLKEGWSVTRYRLQMWSSGDGISWRKVSDSLPFAPIKSFELAAVGSDLWILAGYGEDGSPRFYRSQDGTAWAPFPMGYGPRGQLSVVVLNTKVIAMDSGSDAWTASADGVWSRIWAAPETFPGEWGRTLVAHAGKLWMVSKIWSLDPGAGASKVWSSPDGSGWSMVDANAPIGGRESAVAVSFREKLWVMGGVATGPGSIKDIWYFSDP